MDLNRLGHQLQTLREEAGLSINDVARRIGVASEVLRRAEKGMAELYLKEAAEISGLYGCCVDDLAETPEDVADTNLPESQTQQAVHAQGAPRDETPAAPSKHAPATVRRHWMRVAVAVAAPIIMVLTFTAGALWRWDGRNSDKLPLSLAIEAVKHQEESPGAATAAVVNISQAARAALAALVEHGLREDQIGKSSRFFVSRRGLQIVEAVMAGAQSGGPHVSEFQRVRKQFLEKLAN